MAAADSLIGEFSVTIKCQLVDFFFWVTGVYGPSSYHNRAIFGMSFMVSVSWFLAFRVWVVI